jgi:hypothetical protein
MSNSIKYSFGGKYKWHLDETNDYLVLVPCDPPYISEYLSLANGVLTCFSGYEWDGASGPAIDTANFMRGSLFHDALYQLMHEGVIPWKNRKRADKILREICLADGMSKIRAWWVYVGVRIGAGRKK